MPIQEVRGLVKPMRRGSLLLKLAAFTAVPFAHLYGMRAVLSVSMCMIMCGNMLASNGGCK